MMIREPAFAGRFYAAQPQRCRDELKGCLVRAAETPVPPEAAAADRLIGGIVPHAGWVYSGSVAAKVFAEIARRPPPAAVIIFGAIHVLHGPRPSLFPSGAWETPLGLAAIESRLAERLMGQTGLLDADAHAHDNEHSIEVEVPFVQHLLPGVPIVPIMVPVNDKAAMLGSAVGRACRHYGVSAVFICSTDLTHYGPSFHFTPQGVGPESLEWSMKTNDRRMIDLMLALRADEAVREAVVNKNACGGGAIAATLAACQAYGAGRATLLEHTASHIVGRRFGAESARDTVGYAGIVIEG